MLASYEQQLRRCSVNPAHAYVGGGAGCPLCQIETQTRTLLFLGPLPAGMRGLVFDLTAIWAQINGVPSPGKPPALPALPERVPVAAAVAVGRVRHRQKWRVAGVLLVGAALSYCAFLASTAAGWTGCFSALIIAWVVWAQGTSDAAMYLKAPRREGPLRPAAAGVGGKDGRRRVR
jgi:DNA-binding helix-hairpin-helix protein with protein kinase domain